MAVSDPIADMLTKIRNGLRAEHLHVDVAQSKLKKEVARVLKEEGYIENFKERKKKHLTSLRIFLRYDSRKKPVIHEIKKISTPGRRVYSKYRSMERVRNGYGTLIVSTSHGVVSDKEARLKKVGGELICSVW